MLFVRWVGEDRAFRNRDEILSHVLRFWPYWILGGALPIVPTTMTEEHKHPRIRGFFVIFVARCKEEVTRSHLARNTRRGKLPNSALHPAARAQARPVDCPWGGAGRG
jgi:hypothetical protein